MPTQTLKQNCRDPGSNRGPLDLQSNALPTELSRLVARRRESKNERPENSHKSERSDAKIVGGQVPPRFELGSLDSESRVLTITPWDLVVRGGLLSHIFDKAFLEKEERKDTQPKLTRVMTFCFPGKGKEERHTCLPSVAAKLMQFRLLDLCGSKLCGKRKGNLTTTDALEGGRGKNTCGLVRDLNPGPLAP